MNLKEALTQLRSEEKKKFNQTVDLIVNLKGVDPKRDNIATVISIPNSFKEKKICGFLNKKNALVHTITEPEFQLYKDKKQIKKLVKSYDFFIASANLMPKVATTFGKVLGPSGKMPSPQLGIITSEDDNAINAQSEKIKKSIKIRVKEASIKLAIGKENMGNEELMENIKTAYNGIVAVLPTKIDNVRSVMIKLTMTKPLKVELR